MKTIKVVKLDDEHPLDTAARIVGGRTYLANKLGVTPAAIGNWKMRFTPIEKCPTIESLTQGGVTRRELRPNDWQHIWPELAQAHASQTQAATQTVAQGV